MAGAATVSARRGYTTLGATGVMASDGAITTPGDTDIALGVMVDMDMVIGLGADIMEDMAMPVITDMGDMALGARPMDIIMGITITRTDIGTMPTTAQDVVTPTERTPLPETVQEMPYDRTIIGHVRPHNMPRTVQGLVLTGARPPEIRETTAETAVIRTLPEERSVSTATGRTVPAEVLVPHPTTIGLQEAIRPIEVLRHEAVPGLRLRKVLRTEVPVREQEAVAVPIGVRTHEATNHTEALRRAVATIGLRQAAVRPLAAAPEVPEAAPEVRAA